MKESVLNNLKITHERILLQLDLNLPSEKIIDCISKHFKNSKSIRVVKRYGDFEVFIHHDDSNGG